MESLLKIKNTTEKLVIEEDNDGVTPVKEIPLNDLFNRKGCLVVYLDGRIDFIFRGSQVCSFYFSINNPEIVVSGVTPFLFKTCQEIAEILTRNFR